jgi:ABC-type multidrug transport system fused ATPase/permease subunit
MYKNSAILQDLTLRIDEGERIAIIGESGSGKSTLARLLVRAIDAHSGAISIGGIRTVDYQLAALRRLISYVPQHPTLFHTTIYENLIYANANATMQDMERALEAAQFTDILNRMPRGLKTHVGPAGSNLSGGERQRLAIARSLLRKSPILVLDEATSALDIPTERNIFSKITVFQHLKTLLIISHRVRTLSWVDKVIVLQRGQVSVQGTPEDLYANSPTYRTLSDLHDRPVQSM